MILAQYDVKQHLAQVCKDFLMADTITFSDLKKYILTYEPVAPVHTLVSDYLKQIKAADQQEIKAQLELRAYEEQIIEDEKDKKQDSDAQAIDLQRQSENIGQRDFKVMELARCDVELNALLLQAQPQSSVHVTHHHGYQQPEVVVTPQAPVVDNARLMREQRVRTLQRQINSVRDFIFQIDQALARINTRHSERESRRAQREVRLQARIDYLNQNKEISVTLSEDRKSKLVISLQKEYQKLEEQCAALIRKAKEINYSTFVDQVSSYLGKNTRSLQEVEALRKVIQLMEQHLSCTNQVHYLQASLNKVNNTILDNEALVKKINQRVAEFKKENPLLSQKNERLKEENKALEDVSKEKVNARKRTVLPGLIFSALGLITSIPLILTLAGVIPFFIAPAILFSLFAVPPALLLVVALGAGIIALNLTMKNNALRSIIYSNYTSIWSNKQKIQSNEQAINFADKDALTSLERKLKDDSQIKEELTQSLQEAKSASEQALKRAENIEPAQFNGIALFNHQEHVHQHSSVTEPDESADESNSEARAVNAIPVF